MALFARSILIYMLFIGFALAFRLIFLLWHLDEGYGAAGLLGSLLQGARMDAMHIGWAASVYYLLNIPPFRIWRHFTSAFFTLVFILLDFANCVFMVFYNIYGKEIDVSILLFMNEEFSALAAAAWAENYGILPSCALFFIALWGFLKIFRKIHYCDFAALTARKTPATAAQKTPSRFVGRFFAPNALLAARRSLALFVIFACAMLLSINQRFSLKGQSITGVMRFGSYAAINASQLGHLRSFIATMTALRTNLPSYESFKALPPREAACKMLALSPCPERFDIADVARNSNPVTPLKNRPEKVFYVISESLSDWISEPRFAPLWGEFFRPEMAYLPSIENAPATSVSLQAQFMGVYFNDTPNNYYYAELKPMPTNLITRARKAGYEVHFYFGGSYNWGNLFNLFKKLDKHVILHDRDEAIRWAKGQNMPGPYENNWGAFDDVLFAYARANAAPNTFNIFMTITNHPAYDLAWLPRSPAEPSWEAIDAISPKYRKELATVQWYLRVLGRWLDGARAGELYMITGDHYGRYNVDDSPDAWLTHSVPVFAYSPSERIVPAARNCSHLGIAASIFALLGQSDDVTLAPACFSAYRGGGNSRSAESGNGAESGNKTAVQNRELNFYGFEYSLIGGKLAPTPPEAAALGWYLGYKGQHFE